MIVCLCEGVSESKIVEAIEKGATSLRELRRACGAGTGCGGCHKQILEILDREKSLDKAVSCDIATAIVRKY